MADTSYGQRLVRRCCHRQRILGYGVHLGYCRHHLGIGQLKIALLVLIVGSGADCRVAVGSVFLLKVELVDTLEQRVPARSRSELDRKPSAQQEPRGWTTHR